MRKHLKEVRREEPWEIWGRAFQTEGTACAKALRQVWKSKEACVAEAK